MARNKFVYSLLALAALGLLAGTAQAVQINPGDTIFAPSEPGPVGGVLVDSLTSNLNALTFTGKLYTEVYSGDAANPYGGLTFVYWVENSGPNALARYTTSNFAGFLTDVSYDPQAGRAPTLVDRGVSGDVIGYSYLDVIGNGKILAGETSAKMVVQTDAQGYTRTLGFVINGSTAQGATFAPTQIVPEPSSIALAGMGLAGVIGYALRRRR
ncbi:MAG: PEP-CTERM sorting domain-containing protein [Planctomycetaceae bacterium]|nr:PEP-CTERM sorting domain-containing protein [Planctomycetaceae bacterium]